MKRVLLALAALPSLLAEGEGALTVRILTRDGQTLVGAVQASRFTLESSLGAVEIAVEEIASLSFSGPEAVVTMPDRTTVKGKASVEAWKVDLGFASASVPSASIASLTVMAKGAARRPSRGWASAVLPVRVTTKDGQSLEGTAQNLPLRIETSLGTLDGFLDDFNALTVDDKGMAACTESGSRLLVKAPAESWKVKTRLGELTVRTENLRSLVVLGPGTPERRALEPPPAAVPGVPPAPAPPAGRVPARTLSLKASAAGLSLSPDGRKLYLLNAADGKLLILDPETLEGLKTLPVRGTSMALSRDGSLAAAACGRTVTVVDLKGESVSKSFEVEEELTAAFPLDAQTVYATSASSFLVLSVPKQAVVSKLQSASGSAFLRPTPDGRRLYLSCGTVLLPAERNAPPAFTRCIWGGSEPMTISPDGRFGVGVSGTVYRLSRNPAADWIPCAKVEPHTAAVFLPKSGRLLLFTAEKFLKEYDAGSWELRKSSPFGMAVHEAVADEERKALYVFAGQAPSSPHRTRELPAGDLHRFALDD